MSKSGSAAFCSALAIALAGLCGLVAEPAFADQSVGGAEVVVNDVKGNLAGGNVVRVTQGDGVYRDEQVRTDKESFVRLLLADKTSLALGPSSAITIDKFVYGGGGQTGTIAVSLAKGALRFVTGDAAKSAYVITTPTATLGVRGTILHLRVTPTKTDVLLEEGGAVVCVSEFGQQRCADLSHANAVASVTATSVSVSTASPNTVHTFAQQTSPSSPGPSGSTSGGGTGASSSHGGPGNGSH